MIDDYRRGRAALAFLAGRRAGPLPGKSRVRVLRQWASWAAAAAIGATAVVLVLWGPSVPRQPPGTDPGAVVLPGPSAVTIDKAPGRTAETAPAKEFRFDTWDEASARAGFAVREPSWVPPGFWLSALQSFQPTAFPDDEPLDSIVATYTGPDGDHLIVDQFWLAEPDQFDLDRFLPIPPTGIGHGVVQVAGRSALWQAGKVTLDEAGDPARWDSSVTVLVWLDGQSGFRLEGRGPDLAALVRVGEGLVP